MTGTGRASVIACNRICPFQVAESADRETPDPWPGSTFSFTPVRFEPDGHPELPFITGNGLRTHRPEGSYEGPTPLRPSPRLLRPVCRPPATAQVEPKCLSHTFPRLGRLHLRLHGRRRCGAHRLYEQTSQGSRSSAKPGLPTMVDLANLMNKQHLYAQTGSPGPKAVIRAVETRLHHFAIPTADNIPTFLAYIKRSLGDAESTSTSGLLMSVGFFVDKLKGCTASGLYSTATCPLFDTNTYPWVRDFTILEGEPLCYLYDDERGKFAPAAETLGNVKLLVVTLDSRFTAWGSLPRVRVVPSPDGEAKRTRRPRYTAVLVAGRPSDPRMNLLKVKH